MRWLELSRDGGLSFLCLCVCKMPWWWWSSCRSFLPESGPSTQAAAVFLFGELLKLNALTLNKGSCRLYSRIKKKKKRYLLCEEHQINFLWSVCFLWRDALPPPRDKRAHFFSFYLSQPLFFFFPAWLNLAFSRFALGKLLARQIFIDLPALGGN